MKKLILTASFSMLLICCRLSGQGVSCRAHIDNTNCTDTVPAEATVVTGNLATTAANDCFWSCTLSNLTLYSASTNVNINMENVAVLNASGTEITIWAKLPNTINLDSCTTVKVHIEEGVVVNVAASCSLVDIDTCASIIFNYSEAPGAGCVPTSVFYIPQDSNKYYPVPAHQFMMIEIAGNSNEIHSYNIANMSGQVIITELLHFDASGTAKIDLSGIPAGIYSINGDDLNNELIVVQ